MKTTKIMAAGAIVAGLVALGVSSASANEVNVSAEEIAEFEKMLEETTTKMSFSDTKSITIANLKSDLERVDTEELKTQIEASIKVLSSIESEEEFLKALDSEEKKISKLYETGEKVDEKEIVVEIADEDLALLDISFDDEKSLIIKDLQAQGATATQIEAVKNAKTEEEIDDVFIKMLETNIK